MDPNTTSYERKDVEESLKDEDSLRWRNNSSSTTCCHEGASDDDESLEYDEMETLVGKDGDNVDRRIRKNGLSKSILVKNWLPDGPWRICGAQILEVEAVKLVKFFFVTVLTILAVHYYAIVVVRIENSSKSVAESARKAHFLLVPCLFRMLNATKSTALEKWSCMMGITWCWIFSSSFSLVDYINNLR